MKWSRLVICLIAASPCVSHADKLPNDEAVPYCSDHRPGGSKDVALPPEVSKASDGVSHIWAKPSRGRDVLAEYAKIDGTVRYQFLDEYSASVCIAGSFRVNDHARFILHMLTESGDVQAQEHDGVIYLSRSWPDCSNLMTAQMPAPISVTSASGFDVIGAWPSRVASVLEEFARRDNALRFRFMDEWAERACVVGTFRTDKRDYLIDELLTARYGVAVVRSEDGVLELSQARK